MSDQRATLADSQPHRSPQIRRLADVASEQPVHGSIAIRRPAHSGDVGGQLLSGHYETPSRDAAEKALAADAQDLEVVRAFLQHFELAIESESAPMRTIHFSGAAVNAEQAFSIKLGWYEEAGQPHRFLSYENAISVPVELKAVIVGVLGLDCRPIAKRR